MSDPKQDGMQVYRRLLGYVVQHRGRLTTAAVGQLVAGISTIGVVAYTRPLIDGSFVHNDVDMVRWSLLGMIAAFVLRSLSAFAGSYSLKWLGRRAIADIRGQMFKQLLVLPIGYFDRHASGELMAKLIYNVEQVAAASSTALTILVRESATVLVLLVFLLWADWKLSLIFLIIGPVLAMVVRSVSRKLRRASRKIQESIGDVTESMQQVIDGREEVRAFNGHEMEQRQFGQRNELNRKQFMRLEAVNELSLPVVELIGVLGLAAVIFLWTLTGSDAGSSPGTFVSFVAALAMLLSPLKKLANVNVHIQRGIAAGESVFAFIDEPAERDTGTRRLERAQGRVRFVGVGHAYGADGPQVLQGIDIDITPGQMVALVGRSGSGKSTLVKLLPRFYDFSDGRIEIDGIDIRELTLTSLRHQIALVGQQVTLFNASVRDNLCYGLDRTVADAELQRAAKAAHALEFIEKLPGGFSAQVGEDGVLLSGGQRQRLAIARAILKDAPILALDEATASLDSEAERHIQAALDELMRDRTSLVIAHRLSTIEHADVILVMDQGRIVERGRHAELLAADGLYAELHRVQFRNSGP